MSSATVLLSFAACALALAFPLAFILFGALLGVRGERRRVVAYLRSLDQLPATYAATRIEARAHRGLDTSSLDGVQR